MSTCGCDGGCGCKTTSHFNAQALELTAVRPPQAVVLLPRIEAMERAVIALARAEFDSEPGHAFRGNQHVDAGEEGKAEAKHNDKKEKNDDDVKKPRGFVGKLGKLLGAKPGTILYKEPTTAKGHLAEKAKSRMDSARAIASNDKNIFPKGVAIEKSSSQRAIERADYERKKAEYEKLNES